MIKKKHIELLRVEPGKKISLKDYDTGWAQTDELKEIGKDNLKKRASDILEQYLGDLTLMQQLLYADDRYSLLIVFQAMDAAGKDGTIKHVMSGVNPQGCQVFSFKKPSTEELDHNFLALCGIQWVIKFHFSTEKINHVDKVMDIAVTPGASFG